LGAAGRLAVEAEKAGFRVAVPVGGSDYVDGERARALILRVLWLYGYLAGSSLGSRGALKLAHGRYGDVVPTGKLYLVLDEVSRENPIVEMVWETARGLWRSYGDGVKTAVLLAFKLYEEAARLQRDYKLPPSVVEEGYWAAYRIHRETLRELALRTPRPTCMQAAMSLLTGSQARELLAGLLCRALDRYRAAPCRLPFSEAVAFERIEGGALQDTSLYPGVAVRKGLARPGMAAYRRGPLRVAVVDQKLYVDLKYEGVRFHSSDPLAALDIAEAASRQALWAVEAARRLGVDLLVNVKGVDPLVEERLERLGVTVLRRVPPERARLIAAATGARLVSRLQDLGPGDLGVAGGLEARAYRGSRYTLIEAPRSCASTILVRGPWYAVDTAYEEARMAARGLEAYLADPRGLPGGGAPEVEAALRVREAARRVGGKAQLAMEAYARAVEVIPRTLARHVGLDPEEALARLEALHATGSWAAGVDEGSMSLAGDTAALGLLDLYPVRLAALDAGFSLAASLLRVTGIAVHRRGASLRVSRWSR